MGEARTEELRLGELRSIPFGGLGAKNKLRSDSKFV